MTVDRGVRGGDGAYLDEYTCECGNPDAEHDNDCRFDSDYDVLREMRRRIQRAMLRKMWSRR